MMIDKKTDVAVLERMFIIRMSITHLARELSDMRRDHINKNEELMWVCTILYDAAESMKVAENAYFDEGTKSPLPFKHY